MAKKLTKEKEILLSDQAILNVLDDLQTEADAMRALYTMLGKLDEADHYAKEAEKRQTQREDYEYESAIVKQTLERIKELASLTNAKNANKPGSGRPKEKAGHAVDAAAPIFARLKRESGGHRDNASILDEILDMDFEPGVRFSEVVDEAYLRKRLPKQKKP